MIKFEGTNGLWLCDCLNRPYIGTKLLCNPTELVDISEISSDFEALPITDKFGSFSDVKSIKSSDISVGSSIDLFFSWDCQIFKLWVSLCLSMDK